MSSKLLRLAEMLSSIQRAAKPECQHPPGALAAAAAASPDQHATAIRGCAGERAGEGGSGAGGQRASTWTREEQVAAEPSGGLSPELSKDRTCSLTTPSSSSTPASRDSTEQGRRQGGQGTGGEGESQPSRRYAWRPWTRGRGRQGGEEQGWSLKDPGPPARPEVPGMQGWFG